jgi:O-antigen ligase
LSSLPLIRRSLLVALTVGLSVSITVAELAFAGLALVGLFQRDRRPMHWPLALPFGAFAAWTVVAALASQRPLDSLFEAKSILCLAAFYVVLRSLEHRVAVHRFVLVLFSLVMAVGTLSIIQVAACPETAPAWPVIGKFFRKCGRAHGFFSIYMTLAGVLLLVLVTSLPVVARLDRRRALAIVAWILGVIALGVTFVRGAWIGTAAGVVGCAILFRRRVVALLACAVVVVVAAAAVPTILERIRSEGQRLLDNTTQDRLAMIDGGLRMLRDHPITGIGPGQVKHVYPAYAPPEAMRRSTSHLHNTPLQIAVERGVVGFALWILLYVAFFVATARIYRGLRSSEDRALVGGVILATGAFLLAGLFEYNFGDTEVLLAATTLMALPFIIARSPSEPLEP